MATQPRTTFYALFHWLNVLFLIGVLGAAIGSGHNEVLYGGLVLEVLWLTAGARTLAFQRYAALRNGQLTQAMKAADAQSAQQQLSYEYKQRYRDLEKAKQQLLDAARANQKLEMDVIQPELDRTEALLASFIRVAQAHKKLTQYLQQNPLSQVQADIDKVRAKKDANPDADAMLEQSLAAELEVSEKRLVEHKKIQQTEKALAVQLETIEKTFAFLKTKIVSLQRPGELSDEVAKVVAGVEAAERTLVATDKIEDEIRRIEQRKIGA